jgi:hypothetical protein
MYINLSIYPCTINLSTYDHVRPAVLFVQDKLGLVILFYPIYREQAELPVVYALRFMLYGVPL